MAAKKKSSKKATAKRSTAKRAGGKKSTAKRATAKRSTAKKAGSRKSTTKRATAKRSTAKKAGAARSTKKKAAARPAAVRAVQPAAPKPSTSVTSTSVCAGRMVHSATDSAWSWTFLVIEDHGTSAAATGERPGKRAGARPDHGAGLCGHQAHAYGEAHSGGSGTEGAHHPAAADLPAHSVEGQPHRTAEHHDPRPVHDPCYHGARRRPARDHRAGARREPPARETVLQPFSGKLPG